MKPHLPLLLCMPALFAASCATTPESGTTYAQASSGSSTVNGATFGGQFVSAGGHAERFVLYATGRSGFHDRMTVHGLTYRWSSGVTDVVPESYLGKSLIFRNTMTDRVTQATLHSPGVLNSNPGKESFVTVNADVSIKTRKGTERRTVALRFDRSAAQDTGFQTGATRDSMIEVRRYGVPLSDLDIGANRIGWKP